ncbi:ASCH domain-containing protein [Methylophilus sp.]|uniref:ASCH domain-containing protein n=1 Tax=Methylophilus sp. TaxID=29541 RepID=UPI0040366F76
MSTLAPSGVLKALSLKQPFAWLIANGYLLVDDRSWGTQYRGPILIHASKGLYEAYYQHIRSNTDVPIPDRDKLEYGGVVGIADLVLCSKPGQLPAGISREQRAHFGGVHQEYYGFLFAQARPLPLMPCAGKLGIFEIDTDKLLAAPPAAQKALF